MLDHGNLVTSFRYHNRLPSVVSLGFALGTVVKFSARTVIILGSTEFIRLQSTIEERAEVFSR